MSSLAGGVILVLLFHIVSFGPCGRGGAFASEFLPGPAGEGHSQLAPAVFGRISLAELSRDRPCPSAGPGLSNSRA
jgi:hypothetical protein